MSRNNFSTVFNGELWLDGGRIMLAAFGSEYDVTGVLKGSTLAARLSLSPDNDASDDTIEASIEVSYNVTPGRAAFMGSMNRPAEPAESEDIEVTAVTITDGNYSVDAMDLMSPQASPTGAGKKDLGARICEAISEEGPHAFDGPYDDSDWRKAD